MKTLTKEEVYQQYDEIDNEIRKLKIEKNVDRDKMETERLKPLEDAVWNEKQAIYDELSLKYKDDEERLVVEKIRLQKKLDDFTIEENKAKWLPEGTIVCRWRYTHSWSKDNLPSLTGEKAVVKIFKEGDEYPDNMRWSVPKIGDILIYFLKKDGTPGKRFDQWNEHMPNIWVKEGEIHPEVLKAQQSAQPHPTPQ